MAAPFRIADLCSGCCLVWFLSEYGLPPCDVAHGLGEAVLGDVTIRSVPILCPKGWFATHDALSMLRLHLVAVTAMPKGVSGASNI